jgi:DNA helicase-2/ATP-dependent DNA helicase PcrA
MAEARGIAELVRHLTQYEHVPANEILVLLRGDYRGTFSGPIKGALQDLGIACSDPDIVERVLDEPRTRRMLATFRLLVNPEDSLAWATLLRLSPGIGTSLTDYIYNRARDARIQFGPALLEADEQSFPGGPRSSASAKALIQSMCGWLDAHPLPAEPPEDGWGQWMVEMAGGDVVPQPSADLSTLLHALDSLEEVNQGFGRYLSQITPLGKDHATAESQGVRIMTMNSAKGLTVRATIMAGLEEGIIPRPDGDLQEERRLLYVAMTRSREYLFGTWALRRRGPTARAGAARVALRRNLANFLRAGPVASQDGQQYLRLHGGCDGGRPAARGL